MRIPALFAWTLLFCASGLMLTVCTDNAAPSGNTTANATQAEDDDCADAELDMEAIINALRADGIAAFPDDGSTITLDDLLALIGKDNFGGLISDEDGAIYISDGFSDELKEVLEANVISDSEWEITTVDENGDEVTTVYEVSTTDLLDGQRDISNDIILDNKRECQEWLKTTCRSLAGQGNYKICKDDDICVSTFVKSWCPFRFYPVEVQFYKDDACTKKKGAKTTIRLPTKNLYLPNEPACPQN